MSHILARNGIVVTNERTGEITVTGQAVLPPTVGAAVVWPIESEFPRTTELHQPMNPYRLEFGNAIKTDTLKITDAGTYMTGGNINSRAVASAIRGEKHISPLISEAMAVSIRIGMDRHDNSTLWTVASIIEDKLQTLELLNYPAIYAAPPEGGVIYLNLSLVDAQGQAQIVLLEQAIATNRIFLHGRYLTPLDRRLLELFSAGAGAVTWAHEAGQRRLLLNRLTSPGIQ